jgi:hypothetical protein
MTALLDHLTLVPGITLIAGAPMAGKTTLGMHLAHAWGAKYGNAMHHVFVVSEASQAYVRRWVSLFGDPKTERDYPTLLQIGVKERQAMAEQLLNGRTNCLLVIDDPLTARALDLESLQRLAVQRDSSVVAFVQPPRGAAAQEWWDALKLDDRMTVAIGAFIEDGSYTVLKHRGDHEGTWELPR